MYFRHLSACLRTIHVAALVAPLPIHPDDLDDLDAFRFGPSVEYLIGLVHFLISVTTSYMTLAQCWPYSDVDC